MMMMLVMVIMLVMMMKMKMKMKRFSTRKATACTLDMVYCVDLLGWFVISSTALTPCTDGCLIDPSNLSGWTLPFGHNILAITLLHL